MVSGGVHEIGQLPFIRAPGKASVGQRDELAGRRDDGRVERVGNDEPGRLKMRPQLIFVAELQRAACKDLAICLDGHDGRESLAGGLRKRISQGLGKDGFADDIAGMARSGKRGFLLFLLPNRPIWGGQSAARAGSWQVLRSCARSLPAVPKGAPQT